MKIENGTYRTKAGSTVKISGKHSGISNVEFDWFEEEACIECDVDPYPIWNGICFTLQWDCEECGGGCAELLGVSPGETQKNAETVS